MGTNCAPLVADLFLFCYEKDSMKSLTNEKRYDLINNFNSTSRYLDDLLNIDNIHIELMVSRFGFKSGICLLIVPVPVHCFSITFTEYIPLNFNFIKLMLLILKQPFRLKLIDS